MALDNTYAKERVEAIRKRIVDPPEDADKDLTNEDRNILIEFDRELAEDRQANSRCGWYHHGNLLHHLFVFAAETNALAESLEPGTSGDRALNDILTWIHNQDYSGYTVQGKLSTLRVFASTVLDEMPPRFENIEPSKHVEEDPAPLPSNIIEYSDAIEMAASMDPIRDRALIMSQWSAGLRPMEELYTLQRKNVEILDDHVVISLPSEGKTDRRDVILLVGSPLLKKWITECHPVHDDPEASMGPGTFIWTRKNKNKHLRYGSLTARFREAGENVGIEKDHSPQHFRRSAASVLAAQPYISERDLRIRFSWSPNSDAPEHYIAANADATKVNVARCRGQDVDNVSDSPDTAPIVCSRCGDWTTRGFDECVWCNHNIDREQATFERSMSDPRDTGDKTLEEMILDGDVGPDDLKTLQQLEGAIKTKPDLFEQLDDLITKAEALEAAQTEPDEKVVAGIGIESMVSYAWSAAVSKAKQCVDRTKAALVVHPDEPAPLSRDEKMTLYRDQAILVLLSIPLWTGAVPGMDSLVGGLLAFEPSAVIATVLAAGWGLIGWYRSFPSLDEAVAAAKQS
jgi:site-specific recombinase XerC